jgi:hypothetical protein
MSQYELSIYRNLEGREIEIDLFVDYDYQEYRSNPFGPDDEEGLIINSIVDSSDEVVIVTDYERAEIEEQILDCLREPSRMLDNT